MNFKPFGEWIAVSVDTDAKREYDADGRLVMEYGELVPNQDFAQGRVAELGDFVGVVDVRLDVGDHVVYFSASAQPTFVDKDETFRLIQIGDVVAVNRDTNKEQA